MRIDVLTLFPEMFESPLGYSIPKRAQQAGILELHLTNIRDFSNDAYKKVDDKPYGGGPGMVMMPGPVFNCLDNVRPQHPEPGRVIIFTPSGRKFDQEMARSFAAEKRLIMIACRYEGYDERIREGLNAEPVSIGDYVLSGGELPAMVVIDAVIRLLEGALGDKESAADESFADGLVEYPQYTRPEDFRGMKVPDILLSGHHGKIEQWRRQQSIERTKLYRPDLLKD